MHSVTDRQTDNIMMPIADQWQCDRLKTVKEVKRCQSYWCTKKHKIYPLWAEQSKPPYLCAF